MLILSSPKWFLDREQNLKLNLMMKSIIQMLLEL